jgi:hypothetical protein
MLMAFVMFGLLQLIEIAFLLFMAGTELAVHLFHPRILPNIFNCILLDHLPVIVANRYKYQQSLPKVIPKILLAPKPSVNDSENQDRTMHMSQNADTVYI